MKFELDIGDDVLKNEIREKLIEKLAEEIWRKLDYQDRNVLVDRIYKAVDWSKMAPHIQEALLRKAAEKYFK